MSINCSKSTDIQSLALSAITITIVNLAACRTIPTAFKHYGEPPKDHKIITKNQDETIIIKSKTNDFSDTPAASRNYADLLQANKTIIKSRVDSFNPIPAAFKSFKSAGFRVKH